MIGAGNGPAVILIAAAPPARMAFRLTPSLIRNFVPEGVPGAYLLLDGRRPIYAGRSDLCLRERLATHNHAALASHVVCRRT